jgi:hypothetical protein
MNSFGMGAHSLEIFFGTLNLIPSNTKPPFAPNVVSLDNQLDLWFSPLDSSWLA